MSFISKKRGDQVISKKQLLAIGDRHEARLAADRGADAPCQ
jgi:hypothetical protein